MKNSFKREKETVQKKKKEKIKEKRMERRSF